MDYVSFCDLFYAAHYLPVALYQNNRFVCASGFYDEGDPYLFVLPKLRELGTPSIYVSSDTGYFGYVDCGDGEYYFVLGPAYSTPVTDGFVRSFMKKNAISPARYGEIASFLGGIPQYTYNQFSNLLLYLHFTFTGEVLNMEDFFGVNDASVHHQIGKRHSSQFYEARDQQQLHGTYHFEKQMLELVRRGEPEVLHNFLMAAANTPNSKEGKLAENPLRQAKNLFIGLITMVGKFAAIPGGMDIEQTYHLIDTYIQECESIQAEDAVKILQYNMLMDFVRRVEQQKLPDGVSREVYTCMQYISIHINEPIRTEDIVSISGKSRAYIFARFQQELGMGISEYIMQCRLREAKSLLRYTDKPLSEISSYLCFSSQSHFQNVFKKYFEMTPAEYRRHSAL